MLRYDVIQYGETTTTVAKTFTNKEEARKFRDELNIKESENDFKGDGGFWTIWTLDEDLNEYIEDPGEFDDMMNNLRKALGIVVEEAK